MMDARRVANRFIAASTPKFRFFRFKGSRGWLAQEPETNRWMAEYTFIDRGLSKNKPPRELPLYLILSEFSDGWGPMGRHELATDFELVASSEVPSRIRQLAQARLSEAPDYYSLD